MKPQWDCLLKNLGAWHGSFTRFSPDGALLEETPTIVSLEGLNDDRTIRQTVQRLTQPPNEQVLEYSSLGRSVLFFENGAFSQGPIQFSPVTEFGAELGLIAGDRRLRLVQLFNQRQLTQITLIREKLTDSPTPERPPLSLDALIGDWDGEAITLYPDWRNPTHYSTQLKIRRDGSDRITQQLDIGDEGYSLTSSATISTERNRTRLLFHQGSQSVQVLLLPDGASSTCPQQIQARQSLFLELGWLVQPDLRQRIIRSYSQQGEWLSLTLVTERKVSS